MSPALINLFVFFTLVILVWLIVKLINARGLLQGKLRKEKTLTEDILKQLYHVEQSKRSATLSDLSGALKVRRRKILPLIEAASESGLIVFNDDTLGLTKSGREYALRIVRVHRLWEKYLAERTGHHPKNWHYLAEKMEHKLTDDDVDELNASLGNPLFDPHGDPIPTETGKITSLKWQPLPSYPAHTPAKIVHIEDEPGVIYRQILAKRILIGSYLVVEESTNNYVTFSCEGEKHRLSSIVAANINVMPLTEDEHYEENSVRLSSLDYGETGSVVGLSQECRGASRRRLLDLGILPGTPITVDIKSPMRDPIAYKVRNTSIALRNSLADLVLIKKHEKDGNDNG